MYVLCDSRLLAMYFGKELPIDALGGIQGRFDLKFASRGDVVSGIWERRGNAAVALAVGLRLRPAAPVLLQGKRSHGNDRRSGSGAGAGARPTYMRVVVAARDSGDSGGGRLGDAAGDLEA